MKKMFFIFIMCWFSVSTISASQTELSIEYLFTLGEDIPFGEPGYLISPRHIETDSNGNIFVADRGNVVVLEYQSDGTFVHKYGSRGRGPGEFTEISNISIDEQDRLLVLDRMQFKVARFNPVDGNVEEHHFEDLRQINMTSLQAMPENLFATIYVESEMPGGEKLMNDGAIRVYEFGNGEMKYSLFNYFDHQFNESIPIENNMVRGIGHLLGIVNHNQLIPGHHLYSGAHYIVDMGSKKIITFVNADITSPFYVDIGVENRPEPDDPRPAGTISSSGIGGNFYYQILYNSMVVTGIDGNIFHIYGKNEELGYDSDFYLEVFDPDSELIFHDKITKYFPDNDVPYPHYFSHIDHHYRLYVVHYTNMDDPKVGVYQLHVSGL